MDTHRWGWLRQIGRGRLFTSRLPEAGQLGWTHGSGASVSNGSGGHQPEWATQLAPLAVRVCQTPGGADGPLVCGNRFRLSKPLPGRGLAWRPWGGSSQASQAPRARRAIRPHQPGERWVRAGMVCLRLRRLLLARRAWAPFPPRGHPQRPHTMRPARLRSERTDQLPQLGQAMG